MLRIKIIYRQFLQKIIILSLYMEQQRALQLLEINLKKNKKAKQKQYNQVVDANTHKKKHQPLNDKQKNKNVVVSLDEIKQQSIQNQKKKIQEQQKYQQDLIEQQNFVQIQQINPTLYKQLKKQQQLSLQEQAQRDKLLLLQRQGKTVKQTIINGGSKDQPINIEQQITEITEIQTNEIDTQMQQLDQQFIQIKNEIESQSQTYQQQVRQIIQKEIRGIDNMGATCFLNSFIQLFSQMEYLDFVKIFNCTDLEGIYLFVNGYNHIEPFNTQSAKLDKQFLISKIMTKYKIINQSSGILDVVDKAFDIMDQKYIQKIFTTFQKYIPKKKLKKGESEQQIDSHQNFMFYFNDKDLGVDKPQQHLQELITDITTGEVHQKINFNKYILVFYSPNCVQYQPEREVTFINHDKTQIKYHLQSIAALKGGHWVAYRFTNNVMYLVNDSYVSKVNGSIKQEHYWMIYKKA